MSTWTHCLCYTCWKALHPAVEPHHMRGETAWGIRDVCCRCGSVTRSGIYDRQDPREMACEGQGGTHAKEEAG